MALELTLEFGHSSEHVSRATQLNVIGHHIAPSLDMLIKSKYCGTRQRRRHDDSVAAVKVMGVISIIVVLQLLNYLL